MTEQMKYRAIQEEVRCLLSCLIAILAGAALKALLPIALGSEQNLQVLKNVIYVVVNIMYLTCLVIAVVGIFRAIGHIFSLFSEHYETECRHIDYIANNCVLPRYCEKEYNNEDYGVLYYVGKKHSKKCVYALFITKDQAEERGLLDQKSSEASKNMDSLLNYQAPKMDR